MIRGIILFIAMGLAAGTLRAGAAETDANPFLALDCANCHGAEGQGNDQLKGPAIAALPKWYVISELRKFQKHARGIDPEDEKGTQMHAMAVALTKAQIEELAEFASKQKRLPPTQTIYGNAVRGKLLYDKHCLECHGADAKGIEATKAPPLTGYQDWYILAQTEKFRTGSRGVHPLDAEGIQMHKVAKKFSGEQDVRDVVAYIGDLAGK